MRDQESPPDGGDEASRRQRLSDLADARLDSAHLSQACRDWAMHEQDRQAWHAYQLIGDVMRSEDLASTAAHDAEFMSRFRARLAQEPVVLAPPREPQAGAARRAWWPVAAAAGMMAVVGAAVVYEGAGQDAGSAPVLAAKPTPEPALRVVVDRGGRAMLRDARVDEYLRAHRAAALAGSPAALPGGAMRNVELVAPPR